MRTSKCLTAVSLLCLFGCEAAPAEPISKTTTQAQAAQPTTGGESLPLDVEQAEPATFLAEPGDMAADVLGSVWPTLRIDKEFLSADDIDALKSAVKLIRADLGSPAYYVDTDVTYVPPGVHVGEYDHHFKLNPNGDLPSGWYVLRLEASRLPDALQQRLSISSDVGARFRVGPRLMIQSLEVSGSVNETFVTLLFSSRVRANVAPTQVATVKANGQIAQCESVNKELGDENGLVGLTLRCAALDPDAKVELSFDKALQGLDGAPCTSLDGKSQCSLQFSLEKGEAHAFPAAEAASEAGLKVNLDVQK